ncbi:MAG TPA: nitroreductase family protein, partial [Bacteroidales bacterium]|nr:nitroreductase family protein [Bacteroidales bacterium]
IRLFMSFFKGRDDVYAKIFGTLVEFNQLWAGNAPILAVAIAKTTNTRGEPNAYNAYDLGQAMAMLSIQSTHEGVFVHQMGGFNATEAERILDIPAEYKVLTVFTLGYISDKTELHPNLQKGEISPRTRRPVGESVFSGSFGQKAFFL